MPWRGLIPMALSSEGKRLTAWVKKAYYTHARGTIKYMHIDVCTVRHCMTILAFLITPSIARLHSSKSIYYSCVNRQIPIAYIACTEGNHHILTKLVQL